MIHRIRWYISLHCRLNSLKVEGVSGEGGSWVEFDKLRQSALSWIQKFKFENSYFKTLSNSISLCWRNKPFCEISIKISYTYLERVGFCVAINRNF